MPDESSPAREYVVVARAMGRWSHGDRLKLGRDLDQATIDRLIKDGSIWPAQTYDDHAASEDGRASLSSMAVSPCSRPLVVVPASWSTAAHPLPGDSHARPR